MSKSYSWCFRITVDKAAFLRTSAREGIAMPQKSNNPRTDEPRPSIPQDQDDELEMADDDEDLADDDEDFDDESELEEDEEVEE